MINNVAEQAVLKSLTAIVPKGLPIYVTDEPENKKFVAPCLLIHAGEFEEIITPGSGIYKGPINCMLRWHPQDEDREGRVQATTILDNWANGIAARDAALAEGKSETEAMDIGQRAAATELSTFPAFYCHGFMPTTGALGVDTEKKTIDYTTSWTLWCMPRSFIPPTT